MLTKEECLEALDDIYALASPCKEEVYEHRSNYLKRRYDLISELIEEHFKDKKNLEERFKDYKGEKPKDNPWGDRYADKCSKEEINKWIWEGYGIPPIREKDDVD